MKYNNKRKLVLLGGCEDMLSGPILSLQTDGERVLERMRNILKFGIAWSIDQDVGAGLSDSDQ